MYVNSLNAVAALFEGIKRQTNGSYLVQCPCHDDRTPSLSLSLGMGGKLLFRCHAGCSQDVVAKRIREIAGGFVNRTAIPGKRERPLESKRLAIMPVPLDVSGADLTIGRPLHQDSDLRLADFWEYRDHNGALLFYICRFEKNEGSRDGGEVKKQVLPYCYFDKIGWRHKGTGGPLGLIFGQDRLANRPNDPVLLVEGEKTAIAAGRLFGDHAAVTWQGGANRVQKTDWAPLRNRDVIYWPDADEAGQNTIPFVIERLNAAGVNSLRIVSLPSGLPAGWDLADVAPNHIKLRTVLEGAKSPDLSLQALFQNTSLPELLDRIIYNSGTESFHDLESGFSFASSQMDDLFRHNREDVSKGGVSRALLENKSLIKVMNLCYRPGVSRPIITDENGISLYNTWRGSGIKPIEGDAHLFSEHLRYVCSDESEFDFLANTLAFMVQKLGEKLKFAPVLIGKEGTGKSYIATTMREILGKHETTVTTTNQIRSPFNEWVSSKSLVVVEEIMTMGRLELMNTMKPLITEPFITINAKYKRTYEIENKANFILLSNHEDALKLDSGDRRYFVVSSDKQPKSNECYTELYKWTSENYGVILNWLLERDISGFSGNARPPTTAGKRQMIEASRPEADLLIRQLIDERQEPFQHDLIEIGQAFKALFSRDGLGLGCHVSHPRFLKLMKDAGAINLGQKKATIAGALRKVSLWAIRDREKYEKMSAITLIEKHLSRSS